MSETELPIPSIEKQRAIVKEYNTVVNRIKLNEQLNQKLEETAQTLYKNWFVDFEFPNENGQPYKSSGGKMVYNEELKKEIPKGWLVSRIDNICNCNSSNLGRTHSFDSLYYLDTSNLTNNKIEQIKTYEIGVDKVPSRAKRLVQHNDILHSTVRPNLKHFGLLKYPLGNMVVSTGFAVLRLKNDTYASELIYQSLIQDSLINDFQAKAEMSVSTYPSIKPEDLLGISVVLPSESTEYLNKINSLLSSSYELIYNNNEEIGKLDDLKDLVLSRMTKIEQ